MSEQNMARTTILDVPDSEHKEHLTASTADSGEVRILRNFMNLNHLIMRDLSKNGAATATGRFKRYDKEEISNFLKEPEKNEGKLREAVRYVYNASPHFRRLVQYFVGLSDLSYIVEPFKINPKKTNMKTFENNYRKVLSMLSSMDIKTQIPKILTVCIREDVYYGTLWVTNDNITIQQLPSDACRISSIEGNVFNVEFNFQYFKDKQGLLASYPAEFEKKYNEYVLNGKSRSSANGTWVELDSPTSFAVKCNSDIFNYAIPPFAGILREVFDIENYKELKLTRTELENYAMLVMKLRLEDDGSYLIDYDKAKKFWSNLNDVLPDEIGSVLSPMDIEKISFERRDGNAENTIADAEQNMFTAAGVSSLLFNNEKASANALLLSIKADQAITYGIVKSIGDAINRFLQSQSYGKNFRINFLDVSPWNRKEAGDAYLKAASYGLPTISMYAASQGLGQEQLDSMSFLEGSVLGLQEMFKPLKSSNQMSGSDIDSKGATDEGGAPRKELGDISESGEQNQEDE